MFDEGARLALFGGAPLTTERQPVWPVVEDVDIAAVTRHLQCEELSAYEVVDGPLYEFEQELRDYFDCAYALLVSSGTAALQSALFGLGVKQSDEVVVPAVSYQGTGSVPLHCGATVRLCDVDPLTGNPTLENLEAAITPNTKVVILGHAWGLPADISTIQPFLQERSILLIEDAARAFGSRYKSRPLGTFGEAGCFSFHELKAVPAGEGGLLVTPNREVYENAVALGHYFRSKEPLHLNLDSLRKYRDSSIGLNLKIHPLAACLARSQMKRLSARLADVSSNYDRFAAGVAECAGFDIQPTPAHADSVSRYGFNVIRKGAGDPGTPALSTLVKAIKAEGVKVSTIGGAPLFRLPLYKERGHPRLSGCVDGPLDDANFPGAVAHENSLLRFPTLFFENPAWVDRYVEVLHKIDRNYDALVEWERETAA